MTIRLVVLPSNASGSVPESVLPGERGLATACNLLESLESTALGLGSWERFASKCTFSPRFGAPLVGNFEDEIGRIFPLAVRQVAAALSVNRATIYNGIARGTIPHVRVGHVLRIPVANVTATARAPSRTRRSRRSARGRGRRRAGSSTRGTW